MSTGLIVTGLLFLFWGSLFALRISENGPWGAIIIAGAGLLSFVTGIVLRITERR